MTCLLDVSVLVALLLGEHQQNAKATLWATDKTLAVCPITELGFLRVAIVAYQTKLEIRPWPVGRSLLRRRRRHVKKGDFCPATPRRRSSAALPAVGNIISQ